MIYPKTFENKIGFDRIREFLVGSCLCELGRERVEQQVFLTDYEVISELLWQTSEMKTILDFEENFPQDNYYDGRPYLKRLRLEGAYPETSDLVLIRKSLTAIIQLSKFFRQEEKKIKYPNLSRLASEVFVFPDIIEHINRILDSNGVIKDNATGELQDIRIQIRQKQKEVNRKLISILKQAKAEGIVESDSEITFRDSRPVIPVPASSKRKFGGMIHDESATGKTAFVEPAGVVEINNKVRELQIAENREIKKILLAFAEFIRPYIEDIVLSYLFLADIDYTRAKAVFARRINAVLPIIQNKTTFYIKNAVHPLLFIGHKKENKEVVPLTIYLNDDSKILIISGPNAGGKSVCLKTVGLLQYMLQCGLLLPLSENSEMGVFESIFIDIGDEQSIDNDLSTYSGHLENMKHFVKYSNQKTLVLIDEFGTGTEPALGGAIAEAVLEKLHEQSISAVITTHYANLKHYASETAGILNGAMLFDSQSIKPLYQLSIGKPGSSFALDIARKIGLPEDILSRASEKIGSEHFNYDKQLREIARDKKYWESKRQRIRNVEKTLDNLYGKYNTELEEVQKERKKILKEAKVEAERLVSAANARIERTIREIKEADAEKEKTKKLRSDLERYKEVVAIENEDKDKYQKKISEIKRAGEKLVERSTELNVSSLKKAPKKEKREIQAGDLVKLKGVETSGEVIKVEGKSITVAFGSMLSTVNINKIELAEDQQKAKISRSVKIDNSITKKRLLFKPEIDLRGKRGEEALTIVQQFIDEAVMSGSHNLTILHGKGNGILRQMIRDYLSTINLVASTKDAHADRGGAGITEVKLDY